MTEECEAPQMQQNYQNYDCDMMMPDKKENASDCSDNMGSFEKL